jgi:demethylmenaquinone methyltransferase/2-methoxy-6-polyprenyl-1,4-benzoquinol methylase
MTGTTTTPDSDRATASFGFREVESDAKPGLVREVFNSVAPRYDLMNDLMSGGLHRLWKATLIDWIRPRPGERYIDVAGGTGDIASRIAEHLGRDGGAAVTICDINLEMMRQGRNRMIDRGQLGGIDWVCGDAEALPFPDASFDAYTIAFGLRNVTHIGRALAEARRVLKPGGRFACLEFSRVVVSGLDRLYDVYSFSVLPRLGKVFAGDADAYQYLAESIRRFPSQDDLLGRLSDAGLGQAQFRNLSGGIVALHTGWRI